MRKLFNTRRQLNSYDGIAMLSRVEFALKNQIIARDANDYRDIDAAVATLKPLLNSLPSLKDYGQVSCGAR
jgi:hypothetical protein